MASIDATAGGSASNSYATIAEADAYHDTSPWASNWEAATVDQKTRALITATRMLDSRIEWMGTASSEDQALCWPRTGAVSRNGADYPSDAIPASVRDATSDLAGRLLAQASDPTSGSRAETQGLASLEVGDVAMTFRTDRTIPSPAAGLMAAIWPMVAYLGRLLGTGTSRPMARV